MLPIALGAATVLLLVVVGLLVYAGRARARALADDVHAEVEPYLRRKAAELGLSGDAPTWTSRTPPEEIVGYSVRLAARLLDRERAGPAASASQTKELALAQTQRLDAIADGKAGTGSGEG